MSQDTQFEYDVEAAAAMRGKVWQFKLNQQMKPLICAVTVVHLHRDRPCFDIDFNIDPGQGKDETYYTRLQNVEANFLYPIEPASPADLKLYGELI